MTVADNPRLVDVFLQTGSKIEVGLKQACQLKGKYKSNRLLKKRSILKAAFNAWRRAERQCSKAQGTQN